MHGLKCCGIATEVAHFGNLTVVGAINKPYIWRSFRVCSKKKFASRAAVTPIGCQSGDISDIKEGDLTTDDGSDVKLTSRIKVSFV